MVKGQFKGLKGSNEFFSLVTNSFYTFDFRVLYVIDWSHIACRCPISYQNIDFGTMVREVLNSYFCENSYICCVLEPKKSSDILPIYGFYMGRFRAVHKK